MAKTCPVNFQNVDENLIRIQALFVTLSALAFIFTGWIAFAFLLMYDFTVRLLVSQKFSIFAQTALLVVKFFNITERLVDSAPKIFASQIGFGFSLAIVFTSLLELNDAATIFAIILALCAAMDAFLNYCIGCKFYTILHHFNIV